MTVTCLSLFSFNNYSNLLQSRDYASLNKDHAGILKQLATLKQNEYLRQHRPNSYAPNIKNDPDRSYNQGYNQGNSHAATSGSNNEQNWGQSQARSSQSVQSNHEQNRNKSSIATDSLSDATTKSTTNATTTSNRQALAGSLGPLKNVSQNNATNIVFSELKSSNTGYSHTLTAASTALIPSTLSATGIITATLSTSTQPLSTAITANHPDIVPAISLNPLVPLPFSSRNSNYSCSSIVSALMHQYQDLFMNIALFQPYYASNANSIIGLNNSGSILSSSSSQRGLRSNSSTSSDEELITNEHLLTHSITALQSAFNTLIRQQRIEQVLLDRSYSIIVLVLLFFSLFHYYHLFAYSMCPLIPHL
jgi:hypothetical protein